MLHISLFIPLLGIILILKCEAFYIDELNSIKYEVDLSKIPLINEQHDFPVMVITSSSGKEFYCKLPDVKEELIEKVINNEKILNIEAFLKPMYQGNCLYKHKDWWTYELCFGQAIKQFHIEDGRIYGQVITLGLYESDHEWNSRIFKEKFYPTRQPYHLQTYVNGTTCDLTGLPRSAEVRMFCEEGSLDYINLVDESETCNYVISVHTSLVCSHPLLKSLKEAHRIPCHPLLDHKDRENN